MNTIAVMQMVDTETGLMECQCCGESRSFDQHIRYIYDLDVESTHLLPSQIEDHLANIPEDDKDRPEIETYANSYKSNLTILRECKDAEGMREALVMCELISPHLWKCFNGCEGRVLAPTP